MGWIAAAVFAAIAALLYSLYRRALNEAAGANALLIMVLLDIGVRDAQRDSLTDFVAKTPAENSLDLSQKAHAAFSTMAAKFAEFSLLGVQGSLWKFKQHVDARPKTTTEQSTGARGKITFSEGNRSVITLTENADASTFMHETGHLMLENLLTDSEHPLAPDDLKADADTVRKWLGAKSNEDITYNGTDAKRIAAATERHEKFARGFERYLMEGNAPSGALAPVFAKYKQWLTEIYHTVDLSTRPSLMTFAACSIGCWQYSRAAMSNPSRARLSRKLTVSVAIVIGVSVAAMTVTRSDSDAQTTKGEYKLIEAIDVQGECWEDRVGQHDKYAGQIVRYQSIETGKISTYGFLFRPWSAEQAMDEVAHPTVYHTAAIMEFDDLDIDTNQPKWAIHGVSDRGENAQGFELDLQR